VATHYLADDYHVNITIPFRKSVVLLRDYYGVLCAPAAKDYIRRALRKMSSELRLWKRILPKPRVSGNRNHTICLQKY